MLLGKRKVVKPAAPKRSTRPLAEGIHGKRKPRPAKSNAKAAAIR